MQISVVVPVHNEQDNVAQLIAEISVALISAHTFEMIFVDDGSSDATLESLQAASRKHPQLRILQHRSCCGQSRAIHSSVSAENTFG